MRSKLIGLENTKIEVVDVWYQLNELRKYELKVVSHHIFKIFRLRLEFKNGLEEF